MASLSNAISSQQYAALKRELTSKGGLNELYRKIVNAPFKDKLLSTTIDLGIVVLLLVNKRQKVINRVALSDTELAQGAVKVSAKPFHDIQIPLKAKGNIIAQVISEGVPLVTNDWYSLFTPAMTPRAARLNQAAASIESSLVSPLDITDGGALIFSFYQPLSYIGDDHHNFANAYTALVSKSLQKAQ